MVGLAGAWWEFLQQALWRKPMPAGDASPVPKRESEQAPRRREFSAGIGGGSGGCGSRGGAGYRKANGKCAARGSDCHEKAPDFDVNRGLRQRLRKPLPAGEYISSGEMAAPGLIASHLAPCAAKKGSSSIRHFTL